MKDLIERLEEARGTIDGWAANLCREAVDRIRQLENENEQLKIDKITLGNFGCLPAYRGE